jgi:2'-hydroxyisoflavone reductase
VKKRSPIGCAAISFANKGLAAKALSAHGPHFVPSNLADLPVAKLLAIASKVRTMNRRNFLKHSLAASAISAMPDILTSLARAVTTPKRILVLGGTNFLGPAVVEATLVAGHTVTLFNRGITNPELFSQLEKLRGFRSPDADDQDLSALAHRHWDVVVDVWPNAPSMAASAAQLLKDRTGHYLYVSSIAAYESKAFDKPGVDENSPLEPWGGDAQPYARGKAESERRLGAICGERLTIVRPGPIKGLHDDTPDLLTWLRRAQLGGRHIAPGDGHSPVEIVDVKDVARFLLLAIDRALYGTFNLTGRQMKFREFLDKCKAATDSDTEFVWIPKDFLDQEHLDPDSVLHIHGGNFPFWRPPGSQPGVYQVGSDKAFAAGWQTRLFEETARDCLFTYRSGYPDMSGWRDYLSREKEMQVLEAWARRSA